MVVSRGLTTVILIHPFRFSLATTTQHGHLKRKLHFSPNPSGANPFQKVSFLLKGKIIRSALLVGDQERKRKNKEKERRREGTLKREGRKEGTFCKSAKLSEATRWTHLDKNNTQTHRHTKRHQKKA